MWIIHRLREGSSWASLAAMVGMWAPAFQNHETVIYFAAGICATIGFCLREIKHVPDE